MSAIEHTTLSALDAVEALRRWATDRNLIRQGTALLDIRNIDSRLVQQTATAISSDATSILERQSITAFGVNRKKNTVFVYTSKKISKKDQQIVPSSLCDGVRLVYRQARPVSVINDVAIPLSSSISYYVTGGAGGYYACGSSISPGNNRMAGTLGCLVRDDRGTLYGLTNNHVTGGCNNARQHMPVVGPGVLDVMVGHRDPITIGHHDQVLPMRQGEPTAVNHWENTDAALFKIADEKLTSSMQGNVYDTPQLVIDPEEDMIVEKVGRTTGYTKGVVESVIAGPLNVSFKSVTYHSANEHTQFIGQVYFEPVYLIRSDDGPFSLSGDSGSLVVSMQPDGRRAAIGLIFAGMEPSESYMLPLRPILERFRVSIVSNHHV